MAVPIYVNPAKAGIQIYMCSVPAMKSEMRFQRYAGNRWLHAIKYDGHRHPALG
jgi:hypothetical protein